MKKTLVGLLLVIFSFLGILDAGYITYNEVLGIIPPCRPPFACAAVLKSPWARIGPIPLAAVGMLYYTVVLILSSLLFLEIRIVKFPKKVHFYTEDLVRFCTIIGFFFSLYLITIMAVILQAWCLFCLISASICILLFFSGWWMHRIRAKERVQPVLSFKRGVFRALYQWIAKPFFFQFDAERIHTNMVFFGKILGSTSPTRSLTASLFSFSHRSLRKTIDGISFPNPVGLSAGFDYNADLTDVLPAVGFGFATIGTVTNEPYEGNPRPRLGRYPKSQALLVNKGFKSIGARAIIEKLQGKTFAIPIGISIGSTNKIHPSFIAQIEDIRRTFRLFEASRVKHSYYELNISCPNTLGGQPFTTPKRLEELLRKVDALKIKRPIYLKMPIDLTRAQAISLLDVADAHNIKGVIFGNLTKDKTNRDVHPEDRKLWEKAKGNLSGKPTWNRSNNLIHLTKQVYKSRFTIIGTGGIFTPEDAKFKLSLGADLVQLITGMIYEGPQMIGDVNEQLAVHR